MLTEACEIDHIGALSSRVAMSAMTRGFCGPGHTATDDMAAYYARRTKDGVGLILTEGTIVHPSGDGYNNVPHIHSTAQVESWRNVTNAVRATGGKIYCQLWHCGRISHADFTGGLPPVSSTHRAAEGTNRQNGQPFGEPRALETREMPEIYSMFRHAAQNAMDAGFDGVQIHMGHGYLVDQFFDARVNDRSDRYGGSVGNRCRFGLELLSEVIEEIGPERVAVRISPSRFMGELYDWPDLDDMLAYIVPAFDAVGLRVIDISCANADYFETSGRIVRKVRGMWPHVLMGGASLSAEAAERELAEGRLQLITWGRMILANPDFVAALRAGRDPVLFEGEMLRSLV